MKTDTTAHIENNEKIMENNLIKKQEKTGKHKRKKNKITDKSLYHYRGCIPYLLRYQIVTKLSLGFLATFFSLARGALLWTTDRSAITSGDLPYLMRSPQGWVLLIIGIAFLFLYMVFDVNAMILLSEKILHQRPLKIREIIKEAFLSIRPLLSPFGVLLVLYVAFALPLAGVGLGISLTQNLYIPAFITSYIEANSMLRILYYVLLLALFVITVYYIFTFHYIILKKQKPREAMSNAGKTMRQYWKSNIRRYLKFLFRTLLVGFLNIFVIVLILLAILEITDIHGVIQFRVLMTFSSCLAMTAIVIYALIFVPFQWFELTRIFLSCNGETEEDLVFPEKRHHPLMILVSVCYVGLMFLFSVLTAYAFDDIFPELGHTAIIAHRAGGTLGNENTVYGLNRASEAGADASEIDVQRTKDGYYIINHDDDFKRLAGESGTPQNMTLEEIRSLKVPDNFAGGEDQDFATYEEMLDASEGNVTLYTELKGKTADQQMADDLYLLVKERGMLDQVVFICLDYEVISYLEETHPDANTGYLCYASVGDIEDLHVDELILEEETATAATIQKIHLAGKKVNVWTVDTDIGILRFCSREADGIITDNVTDAIYIRNLLKKDDTIKYAEYIDNAKRIILGSYFAWMEK